MPAAGTTCRAPLHTVCVASYTLLARVHRALHPELLPGGLPTPCLPVATAHSEPPHCKHPFFPSLTHTPPLPPTNTPTFPQVLLFSATLHSPEVRSMAANICVNPVLVDLKGKDSVPETVDHLLVGGEGTRVC